MKNSKILILKGLCLLVLTLVFNSDVLATVDTVKVTTDHATTPAIGSLRAVINNATSGDTIMFASSINTQAINLVDQITINKSLTFIGNGVDNTIVDGSNGSNFRLFDLLANHTISFQGITFQNGGDYDNLFGGAMITGSNTYLTDCIFFNNTGLSGGALLRQFSGGFIINRCIFRNNSSKENGGAISTSDAGEHRVSNSLFHGNDSDIDGEALYINGSTWDLFNNTFTNNGNKEAIYGVSSSIDSFYNNIVYDNNTSLTGGDLKLVTAPSSYKHNLIGIYTESMMSMSDCTTGDCNITGDPLFISSTDFHLQANSPCINAGLIYDDISDSDLDGFPRLRDLPDMGVYERIYCQSPLVDSIIYVDASCIDCVKNGSSWDNAYLTLQDALDIALNCPSNTYEIWVAQGTYFPSAFNTIPNPGERDKTFYIDQNVRIYGGFDGTEDNRNQRDWESNETILSGDIGISGDSLDNSYHIMYIDGLSTDCIIDGFTFVGGLANGTVGQSRRKGGAIYNNGQGMVSNPIIRNCTFTNNTAQVNGGAIYNDGRSGICSPSITNCRFSKNNATNGGAIYNDASSLTVPDVIGVSNPNIIECVFFQNKASSGGAIHNNGNNGTSSPEITSCSFIQNEATFGGGLYEVNDKSQNKTNSNNAVLTNCNFSQNNATSGSAIYILIDNDGNSSPTLINCSFSRNNSTIGAVQTSNQNNGLSNLTITNCSFSNNNSNGGVAITNGTGSGGTNNTILTNCILWNNGDEIENSGPDINMTMSYSTIQDAAIDGSIDAINGVTFGVGNLDADPMFEDAINGDLRLQTGSPAINNGSNDLPTAIYVDRDGKVRILGDRIDMGAYESGDPCSQKNQFLDPNHFNSGEIRHYKTDDTVFANNSILTGADITYDGEVGVCLDKGFEVELGALFVAKTIGCLSENE